MKGLFKKLSIAFAFALGFLVVGTAGVKAAETQRVDNVRMTAFVENGRILSDSRGNFIEVPTVDDLKVALQFTNYVNNPVNGGCTTPDCSTINVEVFIQKLGLVPKAYTANKVGPGETFRKPEQYNLLGLLASGEDRELDIQVGQASLSDLKVADGTEYANTYVVVVKSYKEYWFFGTHTDDVQVEAFRFVVATERAAVVDGMSFYITADNKVIVKSPEALSKLEYYVTDTEPTTENFDEAKAGKTVKNASLTSTVEGSLYVYTFAAEGLNSDKYVHVHALSATKEGTAILTNKAPVGQTGWRMTVPQILLIVLLGILVVVAAAVIIQKIVDHRRKLY